MSAASHRKKTIALSAAFAAAAQLLAGRLCRADPQLPTGIPNDATHTFNITSYGASTLNTATQNFTAISNAIGSCNLAGGGIIVVPAGTFVSLPGITIRNLMNLQIDGTLMAPPLASYGSAATHFLNVASSTHDVLISGSGTLDGNATFSTGSGDTEWWGNATIAAPSSRPRLLRVNSCTRFEIKDLHIQNSPSFHVSFNGSSTEFTLDNVTVSAPGNAPNTDGIDLIGTNGLVKNSTISVGDDNVVMKPQSNACSNVTISTCTFGTGHGVSIGGQTNAGMNGFTVSNCTFTGTSNGIHLKAGRGDAGGDGGGLVQNLSFSNLTMTNVTNPFDVSSYYINGGDQTNPLTPTHIPKPPAPQVAGAPVLADASMSFVAGMTPQWQNVSISSITINGTASSNNFFYGLPEALIQNLTLNNINYQTAPTKGLNFINAADVHLTGSITAPVQCVIAASLELSGTPGSPPTLTQSFSSSLAAQAGTLQSISGTLSNFDPNYDPASVNTVRINGDFNLGKTAGTSGVYNLTGGSLVVGGVAYVGNAGTGVLNQTGGTAVLNTLILGNAAGGLGTVTINSGSFSAGSTAVQNNSRFNFNGGSVSVGSLVILSGGQVILSPSGNKVLRATALSIDNTGQLDLADNSMMIDYSGSAGTLEDDVRQHLLAGRIIGFSGGAANALGYADSAAGPLTVAGQPVDDTTIVIKHTYTGDSNLDGQVDIRDLRALAQHYNTSGNVWRDGDYNYDGVVDNSDLTLMVRNWQAGVAPLAPVPGSVGTNNQPDAQLPEPAAALPVIMLALISRRSRRPKPCQSR